MDSHEIEALVKTLKQNYIHLEDPSRMRNMYCADAVMNEWEVWGQVHKHERTHCIARGRFETCLKALVGKENE